jgi:HJR/Mrr/RecB family endonuclease
MVTAITITVSALSLAVLLMTMVLMCAGISWMVFAFAMFLSVTTLIVIGGAIIRSRNEIYSKRKAFEELQTLECPFKMSPQDKEHLCVDLLEPFILRNERPVGSHGFFAAKRLKAVNSAVDVMLDPAELSMLGIVASSKYGIGFLNDIGHATRVLTSYCLCCDFNLFKRHIEAAEPAYGTVFLAYAAITSNVSGEPLLPFLMHLLELRRVSIAPVDLSRRVDEARAQLEVIRFSKDLESRKSGSFNVTIEMVDSMNPYTFELLLGIIFESLGFCFTETPKSSDQGADVLLERAGERLVIQAKLYTDAVGNKAVQEAIAAREFHRCQFAMVVTNSRFTFSAGELATKAGVKLIGREELIQLLDIFNTRPKDYGRLRQLFQAN